MSTNTKKLKFPQKARKEKEQRRVRLGRSSRQDVSGDNVNNIHISQNNSKPHWGLQCGQMRDMGVRFYPKRESCLYSCRRGTLRL